MNAESEPQGSTTTDNSMRFTRREFWRGASSAWLIFMIILTSALVATGIVQSGAPWGSAVSSVILFLVYGVPVGGVISALAMLAVTPLAWALGLLLTTTDRVAVHLVAFAALGAGVGAAVIAIANLGQPHTPVSWPFAGAVIAACALSVTGGWYWTFWRSRREDWPPRPAV